MAELNTNEKRTGGRKGASEGGGEGMLGEAGRSTKRPEQESEAQGSQGRKALQYPTLLTVKNQSCFRNVGCASQLSVAAGECTTKKGQFVFLF